MFNGNKEQDVDHYRTYKWSKPFIILIKYTRCCTIQLWKELKSRKRRHVDSHYTLVGRSCCSSVLQVLAFSTKTYWFEHHFHTHYCHQIHVLASPSTYPSLHHAVSVQLYGPKINFKDNAGKLSKEREPFQKRHIEKFLLYFSCD